ncbi:MAG: sigma-70 family RNA polymerase sigma factor [Gemmatimonadota bacterium]|nr:MAG: sigma-70 family RNA polymerase sigma factor [Gemmatimonadota bacterium]
MRVNDREISALALAFQRGDQGSLKKLVAILTRPLLARAYRYTGDWDWARDLTQETWVKVNDRIQRYDPSKSFRAWLFTVHRNGCLDHLRRSWLRREVSADVDAIDRMPAPLGSGNPEIELERGEFHRRLVEALSTLSESQRLIFVRVAMEQEEQLEVARDLGISPTTVRTTLHFARRKLAQKLRSMGEIF